MILVWVLLFVGFFILEFITVKYFDSITKNKIFSSGIYCVLINLIYFLGMYEFIFSRILILPIIFGAGLGTALAVYLKKKKET